MLLQDLPNRKENQMKRKKVFSKAYFHVRLLLLLVSKQHWTLPKEIAFRMETLHNNLQTLRMKMSQLLAFPLHEIVVLQSF